MIDRKFIVFSLRCCADANLTCRLAAFVRAGTEHRQQRARFVSAALPQSKGGYYAFQAFGHCHRGYFNDGRRACVGSKQHGRKDARPHHAKDAAGEEHRTGSIRICARSPQAEVQVTISISIHAESQNYPDYNWHARPLKALICNYVNRVESSCVGGSAERKDGANCLSYSHDTSCRPDVKASL